MWFIHIKRLYFPVNLFHWGCDAWLQIPRLVGYVLNDDKAAEGTWNELGTEMLIHSSPYDLESLAIIAHKL